MKPGFSKNNHLSDTIYVCLRKNHFILRNLSIKIGIIMPFFIIFEKSRNENLSRKDDAAIS